MAAWDVWAGMAGQAAQLAWAGLGWLAFDALKEAGVASVRGGGVQGGGTEAKDTKTYLDSSSKGFKVTNICV